MSRRFDVLGTRPPRHASFRRSAPRKSPTRPRSTRSRRSSSRPEAAVNWLTHRGGGKHGRDVWSAVESAVSATVRGIMQGLLGVGGVVRVALVLGLLAVASQTLAQRPDPAVVVITAGDDATAGAAIRIDGEPSGNVPLRKTLPPGRHLVQVGKRGFRTFSKWVDLTSGQVLNMPVTLQPQESNTGSLLITADVTGLPVLIDGQQRGGTPLVVDGLSEGEHVVAIKSPGEGYQ